MEDPEPVDLIHLADAQGNQCVVRVTGRWQPGILTGHDILCASVLVSADFVDARLNTYLSRQQLSDWKQALNRLASERDAEFGGDRGTCINIHCHDDGWLSVFVSDPDRLTVEIGIEAPADWIEDHHMRLGTLQKVWPSEVIETAPMVYEWSPHRRSV